MSTSRSVCPNDASTFEKSQSIRHDGRLDMPRALVVSMVNGLETANPDSTRPRETSQDGQAQQRGGTSQRSGLKQVVARGCHEGCRVGLCQDQWKQNAGI